MTFVAIAGFVGGSLNPARLCDAALDAMRQFGSDPRHCKLGPAAFAAATGHSWPSKGCAVATAAPIACVIDGRIDNRTDLCRALGVDVGLTSPELLCAAWKRWGQATVDKLIGEYALAVFDQRDGETWLARDAGGDRPLYYATNRDMIGFASMPSGLIATLASAEADLPQLARYLGGLPRDFGSSFWRGVRQVPTGTIIRLATDRVIERHTLPVPAPLRRVRDWAEVVGDMRARLDCAVARTMADAGHVIGGQLSSGLDSSAIVSTAARCARGDQTVLALTAAPPVDARLLVQRGRYPDESALAGETARLNGIEHVVIRNSEPLLPAVRGIAHAFQQPPPAQYSFPWWRQMAGTVRARGGRTMLTGGQGNAVISYGGLQALPRYLAQGRVSDWWREARALSRNEDVRLRGLIFNSIQPLLPTWLSTRMLRGAYGLPAAPISFVRKEWRQHSDHAAPTGYLASRMAMIRGFDAGTRKRGMFALTGVEERDPSGDRELIEFSLSLPPEAHAGMGRIKPLIRDALADRVPQSVLTNRLRGMSGADWYDRIGPADCRHALEDIASSPTASELLDLDALHEAVDRWPAFEPAGEGYLSDFGRSIARALSTGLFLAETDLYPLGGAART